MTGKQNAVFWLGLAMILLNFWLAGQSTVIWDTLTGIGGSTAKKAATPPKTGSTPNPNTRTGTNTHGGVQ